MKKHIFGFALFSLIVALFAVTYTFFYAPSIPPKEAVRPPAAQAETREEKPYTCQLRRKNISYEVRSSELNIEKNKFTAQVTIYWNGYDAPPKTLSVEPQVFTLDNVEKSVEDQNILAPKTLVDPFKNGSKATVVLTFDVKKDFSVARDKNVYTVFSFLDAENGNTLFKASKSLPEAHQVLVNYGKVSPAKPTRIFGTVEPRQ